LRKQDQKLKESKAKLAKATAGADQSLRDELSEVTKKSSVMKVRQSPSNLSHPQKSHQQEIALRNKELQMMASAFHDLGYRTQLNGFVVEKQSQGPASFLAQQRNSIPSLSRKD
jgi:hypothetical protein